MNSQSISPNITRCAACPLEQFGALGFSFLFCLSLFNQSVFRDGTGSLLLLLLLKTFQPVVKSFAWGKRKVSAFVWPDSLLKKRTFSSPYCMNDCVHLYSSPRCDGWIWAKDWSSVSRVCSRRQRIHRKAGMLCSGKVSWHPWSAGICSLVASPNFICKSQSDILLGHFKAVKTRFYWIGYWIYLRKWIFLPIKIVLL